MNKAKPELVKPLYFRKEDKYLFGCHHLPGVQAKSGKAAVLCPASGDEYYYSHRTLRQLAAQLARAGFHVLRFDYFGTGDSAGNDESATLAQWRVDINCALDELKRLSRCDQISLIGIRLGATLAMQATEPRKDINNIVLWNPLLTGSDLLDQWTKIQFNHNRSLGYHSDSSRLTEIMGTMLSKTMVDELQALQLTPQLPPGKRSLVIVNRKTEAIKTFTGELRDRKSDVSLEEVDDPEFWQENQFESTIASTSLKVILRWLGEEGD